ncbi:MAG: hypothetical protein NC432_14380 [Roseburia sp.]|nr:hypothetical protein [Roseburia sp.]MCM1099586.1 hypothetical protein [Ruminococcus flavefaciens]
MRLEEIRETMLEIADILNKFPECLQEKAFDVMVRQLFSVEPIAELSNTEEIEKEIIVEAPIEESIKEKGKKIRKKNNTKDTYQINKDLNLSPRDKTTLKEFVTSKNPQSNIEFNAVAIYYLQKILAKENISVDDVYSCYKDIGRKVPNALKQSLTDTSSSKYGYVVA